MLKHEISCFTIKFSKDLAKAKKSKQWSLEKSNLSSYINWVECTHCKNKLGEIYDDNAEGTKVIR